MCLGDAPERVSAAWSGRDLDLTTPRGRLKLHWIDPFVADIAEAAATSRIVAPMPGTVTRILAEPGADLPRGAPLIVLEAMKMEHTLRAPGQRPPEGAQMRRRRLRAGGNRTRRFRAGCGIAHGHTGSHCRGGPTGLTLAIDLGRRGVRAMVIEQKEAPQFLPKMERCNARTMEIYRRMGIADKVRAAGLPAHCPMDIFIVLSLIKPPLVHLPHPSVAQAKAPIAQADDGREPLEPYQLISQYTLEPLLKSIAEKLAERHRALRLRARVVRAGRACVTAQVKGGDGASSQISAPYMVGCDGGTSLVRRQLGITLHGEANIMALRQALYYCEDLYERIPIGKGRHYHVADDQARQLIVQDFDPAFHAAFRRRAGCDMARMFEEIVAMPVKYEMLYVGQWKMNLLLADRYGEGRVFLAGDAVHLVIPTGGLGMNTGVGDAIDLSWKLAATLRGWGGPKLLASYEIERRQVGERNVAASRHATHGRRKWRAAYRPDIGDDTPLGAATRANLARVADVEQHKATK